MRARAALLVVTALLAACGSGAVTLQGADEFADTIADPAVVVIDVRSPQEYAEGRIEGAINIDVDGPDFQARIAELDPSTHYAVYCRSGRRSAIATKAMADAGIQHISELRNGIIEWNGPLVTG